MTDEDLNFTFGNTSHGEIPPKAPDLPEEAAPEPVVPDHTPETLKIPPEDEPDAAEPVISAMSESFLHAQENFIRIAAVTIFVILISITLIVMRSATQHNSAVNLLNFETVSTGRYTATLQENFYNDIPGKGIAKKLDHFFEKLIGFSGVTPPSNNQNKDTSGLIPTATTSVSTDNTGEQTTTTKEKTTKKTTKKSDEENYETLNVETGAAYSGTATSTKEIKTTSTKKFSLTTTKKKAEKTTKTTTTTVKTKKTDKTKDTTEPNETTPETTAPPEETTTSETVAAVTEVPAE